MITIGGKEFTIVHVQADSFNKGLPTRIAMASVAEDLVGVYSLTEVCSASDNEPTEQLDYAYKWLEILEGIAKGAGGIMKPEAVSKMTVMELADTLMRNHIVPMFFGK